MRVCTPLLNTALTIVETNLAFAPFHSTSFAASTLAVAEVASAPSVVDCMCIDCYSLFIFSFLVYDIFNFNGSAGLTEEPG